MNLKVPPHALFIPAPINIRIGNGLVPQNSDLYLLCVKRFLEAPLHVKASDQLHRRTTRRYTGQTEYALDQIRNGIWSVPDTLQLNLMFVWDNTPERHDFWLHIATGVPVPEHKTQYVAQQVASFKELLTHLHLTLENHD